MLVGGRLLAGLVSRLVTRLGFRLLTLRRIALLGVGRLRRREAELAAQLALGGLAAAHRFLDQFVGQHQPRVRDVLHHQENLGVLVGTRIVAPDAHRVALDAGKHAAEPLAALMRHRHFDLHEMPGIALEVGAAHQRAVDPGRRDFQPVGALDRVGDVEHRRQRARDRLAILELHRAVGPLRHDLHGAAGIARDLDAHQAIAHALQHRDRHRGDARRDPGLDDETRLGEQFGVHGRGGRFGHIQCQRLSKV
ncbi:hypothetical protein ABIF21_004576 [Bradyrhizobium elkanii]